YFLFTDTHHLNKMEGNDCLPNFENKRQNCIQKMKGCFFSWFGMKFIFDILFRLGSKNQCRKCLLFSENVFSEVFENILLSTYTGRLVMPVPEIVSYLTAASFLQMWPVVDECMEVLEGNPTVLCQKMNHGSDHQYPSSSSYNDLIETFELGSGGQTEFHKVQELRDGENEEESSKDELSCQLTEHEYLPSNSSTEHDRLCTGMTSQDGEEGTSSCMEEFFSERADGNLRAYRQDLMMAAGYGESIDMAAGIKEEKSLTGFSHADKLYLCQCGKSFTYKSQRDRHMSMHRGLRPYGCGVCDKKFKMKHHLVGHMKIHMRRKPCKCNICGKRFMWWDSFRWHVTSCTKSYQLLKDHGRHSGLAPCRNCDLSRFCSPSDRRRGYVALDGAFISGLSPQREGGREKAASVFAPGT
uniref:Uncharacterized protein n=1 Tax=Geospiza parvula TaxID=87175 RepID=A0A8C3MQC3_GEOPR